PWTECSPFHPGVAGTGCGSAMPRSPCGAPGSSWPWGRFSSPAPCPSRCASTATCAPICASSCPRERPRRSLSRSSGGGAGGGLASLAVVVRTGDLKAGERFVDALGARLSQLPKHLVARIFWRIDEEREFFDAHGALYAEVKDLEAVRKLLVERIAEAKRSAN